MIKEKKPVILIPFDFTEVSNCAVKHATALAKIFGFSITLLNIYDISTRKYLRLSNMKKTDLESKLKEISDGVKQSSAVDCDYFYKKGSIKTIRKIAEDLAVSLMVIGIDEPLLKISPILKVVSKSPVPVMVVQQKSEMLDYKHIMFPLDEFYASRQKVGWASRLAKATQAQVSIISINQIDKEKVYKHQRIIEQVEEFFHKRGIAHSTKIATGGIKDFPEEALQFGIDQKCDVFVIMYQPKKFFSTVTTLDKRLIFNDSRIPVLCVNLRDLGVAGGFN